MVQAVRYRTGTNAATGRLLRGFPHLEQSLADIWATRLDTRVIRLDYGSDLRSHLGEDITPALALAIYNDMVEAAHTHEPEYRIADLQFVRLERSGALAIRHRGRYYPEGRFGDYQIFEERTAAPLALLDDAFSAAAVAA